MGFAWTKKNKKQREREYHIPHLFLLYNQNTLQKALTPSKHSNDVKLYTA